MTHQIKIKLYVGTGFASCNHEDYEFINKSEWEVMPEEQQEQYLEQAAYDYLHNNIEYCAWVVEEEDEE